MRDTKVSLYVPHHRSDRPNRLRESFGGHAQRLAPITNFVVLVDIDADVIRLSRLAQVV